LYDLLGVEKGVSEEEVRAGYRRTAVRNHPDKFPEEEREKANERMMRINAARDVLVDPARRRVYDETG
ncbi:heat shock protein DnaJ, partial [Lojkania enalia]